MLLSSLAKKRRLQLRKEFDLSKDFKRVEEGCLPSYAHKNIFAAWAAWNRLEVAARLYKDFESTGPVLDFGSSTGELLPFLNLSEQEYFFVEENALLGSHLKTRFPGATQLDLSNLPEERFETVFGLDSLEHNENVPSLVNLLLKSMKKGGHFILSGPTENILYRMGRRIAGFEGHYHKTNIYHIESVLRSVADPIKRLNTPIGLPLFSVSLWQKK